MNNLRLHALAAMSLICCTTIANAEQVHIDQPGFEADGAWKLGQSGQGVSGLFADAHERYLDAGMIDPVPGRDRHFMYNNGEEHDVYQVLQATVQANTTYTLSIVAIDATFSDPFPGGELRLGYVSKQTQQAAEQAEAKADADAEATDTQGSDEGKGDYGLNLFRPVEVDRPLPFNDHENEPENKTDGFVTWTYTFTTGESPQGLGQPLRVEILGGGGAQAIFDNVALRAQANSEE